jgi:ABC-type polysaccharide/polyol phosphate transport system ATPase subunit
MISATNIAPDSAVAPGQSDEVISLKDITKEYPMRGGGKRTVLQGVSFEVRRGQSIGILGRNGSGKSTLIKIVGGAIPPTTGAIVRGMSVSWPLGFVGGFQTSLTGADNVRFIARLYGVPAGVLHEYVDDFAELGDYMRMPVRTYSSGMCARLMFGISLALEFDCYLIDEATAVGDARFVEKCDAAMARRRQTGALVMVSHSALVLRKYCDRGAILDKGHFTLYDDLEEAIRAYEGVIGSPVD